MARPTVKERNEWNKEKHILKARIERQRQTIEEMQSEIGKLEFNLGVSEGTIYAIQQTYERQELIIDKLVGFERE